MTDSWRTSRTRQAQQRQRAEVKADREMHETGPWGEGGSLRLPEWMQGIPAMPDTWPVGVGTTCEDTVPCPVPVLTAPGHVALNRSGNVTL